jgi:hypothetical protein
MMWQHDAAKVCLKTEINLPFYANAGSHRHIGTKCSFAFSLIKLLSSSSDDD